MKNVFIIIVAQLILGCSKPAEKASQRDFKQEVLDSIICRYSDGGIVYRCIANDYLKRINSCQLTEMFGENVFVGIDTLIYGRSNKYDWPALSINGTDPNDYYRNFNVNEIYKDTPFKVMYLKDWYIGNYQLLRGYYDTDNGCDYPVYATIFSFDPDWYKPYYITEFKDKSPEEVSEILAKSPFERYTPIVMEGVAIGIYESWINPRYASDGDTLEYIVWRLDDWNYLELFYKEIKPDSLIMVGGDWFNATYMQIDW